MGNLRLVLFSGGCDSTLALYDALNDQKTWILKGKPLTEVRQIAIIEPCVPMNSQQKRARERIIAEFKRRGLQLSPTINVAINHPQDRPRRNDADAGSVQTAIWIGLATPYLQGTEDLVIGWHEGEFGNLAAVQSAFAGLQSINGEKTGKLLFPLREVSKVAILARLQELNLLRLCWYCEGGDHFTKSREPCGTCNKCIAHETALWQLKHWPREVLQRNGIIA